MKINLRLEWPNMKGPAVRRLQELGDLLGVDTGPNDGIYGVDTDRMVRTIQGRLGVCQDGIVGRLTWRAMRNAANDVDALVSKSVLGIHNITRSHGPPKNFAYLRGWNKIKGVTLHQTGCDMPESPHGWSRVNAHYGVTREGVPLLLNAPEDMIWHAQMLSPSTIGIEIEGNYEGVWGVKSTLWLPGGGPNVLNPKMIDALDIIFEDVRVRFNAAGANWRSVNAHRQSSRFRRSDPGSEIWTRVAIPWIDRLKLGDMTRRFYIGSGRPIPHCWDDDADGVY